jgi:hypothetical protein
VSKIHETPKQIEAIEAEPVTIAAEPATPAPVLELTEGRAIAMKFGAHEYTWIFRRITRSDWERFFRSFDTESVMIQGEETETFEVESGTIDLARSCVVKVEGYTMPDAGDWRAMLPLGHLKAFGQVLRDVRVAPVSDDAPIILSELSEISLECIWDGKSKWSGLVHRFNPPTLQQQRKFNRACGTYRVLGNERGNRTIYPARQALMMDFYDELIVSVDASYRANGDMLLDRASIVREMDASHKVAAIQGLLNAGGAGRIVDAAKGDSDQK